MVLLRGQASFYGPTKSADFFMSFCFVAQRAKRLLLMMPPIPYDFANMMHTRMVLSFSMWFAVW